MKGFFKSKIKFRKVIALLMTCVVWVATLPVMLTSASTDSFDRATFLNRLGINVIYDENSYVTRGDFAVLAMQASSYENVAQGKTEKYFDDVSEKQERYINSAVAMGYIYGAADKKFYPDRIITVSEAYAICLRILGWGDIANITDLSNATYLKALTQSGIAIDSKTNNQLTCADAVDLLFNMLDSKYIKAGEIKVNDAKYIFSDNTYMNEHFAVYKGEGTINSVEGISINGKESLNAECLLIDNEKFENLYYRDIKYLGRNVTYYAIDIDSYNDLVLYIRSADSDSYDISSYDIVSVKGYNDNDAASDKKSPSMNVLINWKEITEIIVSLKNQLQRKCSNNNID